MKHYLEKNQSLVIAIAIILLIICFYGYYSYRVQVACCKRVTSEQSLLMPGIPQHTPKHFKLDQSSLSWLSKRQIDEHLALYIGYVKKRNEIMEALYTIDRTEKGSKTYSPFRSLKVAETYAHNGALLHELYFENITKQTQDIGTAMLSLITDTFGSIEAFRQDFILCANCARGWVMTAYSIPDKRIYNFLLEEHNQTVPVLVLPLLVLDVYEHAYMIDFGINKQPYLDAFWNGIDWSVVEDRITKWVKPLQ